MRYRLLAKKNKEWHRKNNFVFMSWKEITEAGRSILKLRTDPRHTLEYKTNSPALRQANSLLA